MPLRQCQRCDGQIVRVYGQPSCLACGHSPEPPATPDDHVVDGRYQHLNPARGRKAVSAMQARML